MINIKSIIINSSLLFLMIFSYDLQAQQIKTLPVIPFVDNNTTFVGQENHGGTFSNAYQISALQIASYIGGASTVIYNKYGVIIFSNDSICVDTSKIVNKRYLDSIISSIGGGTTVYNKYGTKIFSNDSILIDTSKIPNFRQSDSLIRVDISGSNQKIPVFTSTGLGNSNIVDSVTQHHSYVNDSITLNGDVTISKLSLAGNTDSILAWGLVSKKIRKIPPTTGTKGLSWLYPSNIGFIDTSVIPNFRQVDSDIYSSLTAGYGIIKLSRTLKLDSATSFADLASTFSAGLYIRYTGRTFSVDTLQMFPTIASTFSAGYGLTKGGRTYILDSATFGTYLVSTLSVGYGLLKGGRTFKVDTATLASYILSTLGAGTNITISGRTISASGGGGGSSPGGLNGAVQYKYGSTTFGGDATHFVWDSVYKRLGVGSSTPSQTLSVSSVVQSIIVTGSMSPDVTGTYIYGGQYNSHNYYVSYNGYIWHQSGGSAWFISPILGVQNLDFYDLSGGVTPVLSSAWTGQNGASGTPTTSAGSTDAFTVDTSGNVMFDGTLTGTNLFVTSNKLKLKAPSDTFEIIGSNSDFNIYTDVITGGAIWIDMPITGPSGIGTGGPGSNPWIAYAFANGNWFSNSLAGDICYRNPANILWGNGTGNADMALHNGMLGIGTVIPSQSLDVNGNILIESTGKLIITGGTNGTLNTIALSSGTVTVSNTSISTGDLVYIQYASGTALSIGVGNVSTMFVVPTITSGTSFIINALTVTGSVNVTDNSTVQYLIVHKN